MRVGLSISEPAHGDLVRRGLSELHVRHAFIEVARHLLAAGHSIAYGGDFRAKGYSEAIFDLIRTYARSDLLGEERVDCYMAWPMWLGLSASERAALAHVATLVECSRPDGAPQALPPQAERNPDDLLWQSLALTAMRRQMTDGIDARVVLGGRVAGQQGLYPGVAEEAALALRVERPLFVAGGFGGCGGLITRALEGDRPRELGVEYQLQNTPRYEELLRAARDHGYELDYDGVIQMFARIGAGGLGNGLDEEEGRKLAGTDDVDEIVALILRGVRCLGAAS